MNGLFNSWRAPGTLALIYGLSTQESICVGPLPSSYS